MGTIQQRGTHGLRRLLALVFVGAIAFVCVTAAPASARHAQAAGALKVQYQDSFPGDGVSEIDPWFKIVNTGTSPVTLSALTLRYWYTPDSANVQTWTCSFFVSVNCPNITGTVKTPSCTTSISTAYLEIAFTSGASSIAAGSDTGEIQSKIVTT